MQPNRIRNLRSQIAANRYRKSKDEHTATEAYNYLTPDANTRYTKVSDYLHALLPKVEKILPGARGVRQESDNRKKTGPTSIP